MNARLFLLMSLAAAGCSAGDAHTGQGNVDGPQPPEESQIARVERAAGQPTTVVTTDGKRIVLQGGEATVGDTLVLESRDGQIEYHRTPSAIMAELSQTKVAYVVEGGDELVFFDGLQGNPYIDPVSGKLCWMAVTCTNKACSKAGSYFCFHEDGFSVGSGGQLVEPDPQTSQRPTTTRPCPTCGSKDHLMPYRSAEISQRRAQLDAELEAARKARVARNRR